MAEVIDFLVIGSGIAGLRYALEVAEHGQVIVLAKDSPTEGSTRYAQGGIASVSSPLDSFEAHEADTINAGAGLCETDIVSLTIREGPREIQRLVNIGTNFDISTDTPGFSLGREGGHSSRRILHAGDATGAEIQRAIFQAAENHPNIQFMPYNFAVDLIQEQSGRVIGCYAFDSTTGNITAIAARCTMLATGGAGKVYLYTTNPDVATGDGIAMAFRAGALVGNLEFIQFHPTCLFHPQAKSFLLTEALRGEGAKLCLPNGDTFMHLYDEREELASRDIVARAIDDQMKMKGFDYVLLDATHLGDAFLRKRFPTITERLAHFGFDLAKAPVPVVPAAHYCCGGVHTDSYGKTSLLGLYAAGETAYTGLHGANRLASNSLLEALVFAGRAAKHSIQSLPELPIPRNVTPWQTFDAVESSEAVLVSYLWDEVRRLTWNLVGIVRSDKRLALAQRRIEYIREEIKDYYWKFIVTKDLLELRNITLVAELVIRSASQRKESRGLHYTTDYPSIDNTRFKQATMLSKTTYDSDGNNTQTTT